MKDIKRRSFIKNTIIAGAGAALAPQILLAEDPQKSTLKKTERRINESRA